MKRVLFCILMPILAILVMSHNTFATDVVPSGANASGWNSNPKISCYTLSASGTAWSGFNNYCAISVYPASKIGVRAVSFRDKNGASIWAYTGDYLQIQLTITASGSEVQPQMYYLPDDNANLQMISMKVDGSFTASEGKELIITYYAKYLGANNPSELMMGSTTGREFLSYYPNNYILGGMSVSAWHVESDNNDDVVAAIEQQTQQEQNAANDIQNQSASDIGNSTNEQTQSLLNAFGSFVSAVASISPSNCNVDFDLGHIDFGEQNLCSVSVPTVFTSITSIIVIMFTIPFVYHLVNRILGLIREMQT